MDSNKHAGDLDDSFGKGGIVEPPDTVNTFGHVINVLVSSEEKIFIIGELARHYSIVSLNKDGSMNSDFNNGKIIKDIFKAGFLSAASEIKLTQDNNILIAGTYEETEIINYHALALYKQDGSLSANFGQGGKIIIYLPAEAGKYASPPKIIPLPDKKILAVSTRQANYRSIAVLYRLEQNGEIDNTFGDKGYIDISYRKRETSAQSMLRQPDGKLLIAGMVRVDSEYGSYVGFVARFNSDGTPDTSFAEEGYFVNTKTYGFEQITSIELLLHGKIVATGNASSDKKMTGLLLCLTTEGKLDPMFNGGKPIYTTLDSQNTELFFSNVCVQSDKKIVVQGGTPGAENADIILARYLSTGRLDDTFGQAGWVRTKVGKSVDIGRGMALQRDERIVVGGSYSIDGTLDGLRQLALRYLK